MYDVKEFKREKKECIKAAKELFYPTITILELENAKTSNELVRIMKKAREAY